MRYDPFTYMNHVGYNETITFSEPTDIWVIGDVHGCTDEFESLCKMIRKNSPNGYIFQLGDLIDRGPFFKSVFDVVKVYDIKCTIGNHELNFILEKNELIKCNSDPRKISHYNFMFLNEGDQKSIYNMMTSFKNSYTLLLPDNNVWQLSHAPIKKNAKNALGYCGSSTRYDNDYFVDGMYSIHGHMHWDYEDISIQARKFSDSEIKYINVDAGCVYGGDLVAYNITTNKYLKVKAKKTYFNYTK